MHHLDVPWRPRDIEQREGRIVRQGNEVYGPVYDEETGDIIGPGRGVKIYQHLQEGSFDEFMWQAVEKKARSVKMLMKRNVTTRSIEDVNSLVLGAAEAKALASGNPLVLRAEELKNKVNMLRLERAAQRNQASDAASRITQLERVIDGFRERIPRMEVDARLAESTANAGFTVGGKAFDRRPKAGEAMAAALKDLKLGAEPRELGRYKSFTFSAAFTNQGYHLIVSNPATGVPYKSSYIEEVSPARLTSRVDNLVKGIPKTLEGTKDKLEQSETSVSIYRSQAGKPFERAGELSMLERELRATQAALSGEPVENYPAADDWSQSDGRTREPEPTESLNADAEWRRTATEVAPMLAAVELRAPEAPSGDSWLLPVAVDSARRATETSLDDKSGQEVAPRALAGPEPDVPAPAPQDAPAPVAAEASLDDTPGQEVAPEVLTEPEPDIPAPAPQDAPAPLAAASLDDTPGPHAPAPLAAASLDDTPGREVAPEVFPGPEPALPAPAPQDAPAPLAAASLDDAPSREVAPEVFPEPEPDVPAPAPQDAPAPLAAIDNTPTTPTVDDWSGNANVPADREEPNQDAPELARRDEPIDEPIEKPIEEAEPTLEPAPMADRGPGHGPQLGPIPAPEPAKTYQEIEEERRAANTELVPKIYKFLEDNREVQLLYSGGLVQLKPRVHRANQAAGLKTLRVDKRSGSIEVLSGRKGKDGQLQYDTVLFSKVAVEQTPPQKTSKRTTKAKTSESEKSEPGTPSAPMPEVTDSQKDKPAKTPVKLKSAIEEAERVPKVSPRKMVTEEADDKPPPKLKEAKGQQQEMGISEGDLESLNAALAEKEAELERVKKSRPKGGIPKFVAVDLAEKELARAKRAVVKAQKAPPPPKAKAVMTARRKGLHPMQKLRKEIRRAQGARA